MAGSHKLRAQLDGDGALVKMLLRHPMETGARKNPGTGEPIPRNFIQELRCERNDKVILSANWGWGISKNPYLSFHLHQAQTGDVIRVSWKDNLGNQDAIETQVK